MLWNRKKLDEFIPSRRICQGDPIFPYFFVLCIERLFHIIGVVVSQGLWKPLQLSRGGPHLSYFAFVDDVFI